MAFTDKPTANTPAKTIDQTRAAQKQPGQDPVDPQSKAPPPDRVAVDPPRNQPARKLRAVNPVEEPSLPEDDA